MFLQAPVDQDLAAQQEIPPAKMKVPQLKEQLKTFNMLVSGKKADLVHRLETALAAAAATGHASDASPPNMVQGASSSADRRSGGGGAVDSQHQAGASSEAAVLNGSDIAEDTSHRGRQDAAGNAEGDEPQRRGQKGVGDVQPGTQGLGDVATFEVTSLERPSHWV